MTVANTYNTGNPLESADPRDTYDNSSNFDEFVNSSSPRFNDRFGVSRRTVNGINQAVVNYVNRGEWTTATAYNVNDIWRNGPEGAFYLVLADYTSGASAAADIASGNVTVQQPKDWVVSVNTWSDLETTFEPAFDGQLIYVSSRIDLPSPVASKGGGMFQADFSDTTTASDGGTVAVTAGGKRIKRINIEYVTFYMFGATLNGITDESAIFSAAATSGYPIQHDEGVMLCGNVSIGNDVVIRGAGTIKKLSASESAIHFVGDSSEVTGIRFESQPSSGQPNTCIKLGDGSSNTKIMQCHFESDIYSAIAGAVDSLIGGTPYANPSDGVLISECTVKGFSRPIYLHSVANFTITTCIFRDTAFDAIRLRENCGYGLITNNQFINIGDPAWLDNATRDAVDAYWSGDTLTISNNIVKTTAFAAFDIKGDAAQTPNTRRVIIVNNQIDGTRFNAIYIAGDLAYQSGPHKYITNIIVDNNIIARAGLDGGHHGIYLENMAKYVAITNNMVIECRGRAIYAHNSDQTKPSVKTLKITGNICVNNGVSANQVFTEAAISAPAIDGLLLSQNICENDPDMDNPYQACGIFLQSVSGVFAPSRTAVVTDNTCRNNTVMQIATESNGNRIDNIAVFRDNLQSGPGALQRNWHDTRRVLHGTSAPAAGDGAFQVGDIVFNVAPSAGGYVGWSCVTAGTPGVWKEFGQIIL